MALAPSALNDVATVGTTWAARASSRPARRVTRLGPRSRAAAVAATPAPFASGLPYPPVALGPIALQPSRWLVQKPWRRVCAKHAPLVRATVAIHLVSRYRGRRATCPHRRWVRTAGLPLPEAPPPSLYPPNLVPSPTTGLSCSRLVPHPQRRGLACPQMTIAEVAQGEPQTAWQRARSRTGERAVWQAWRGVRRLVRRPGHAKRGLASAVPMRERHKEASAASRSPGQRHWYPVPLAPTWPDAILQARGWALPRRRTEQEATHQAAT
mmetsp:Transcript_30669/g.93860  ORF Transcript_30669/g.93860 Transcript_30669/m.93860 type:complete len:268 (-) Transcript_30669:4381-5184(-)|eukprot:scaffold13893_cov27-Tisochrysis_lutea.AAC.2